MAGSLLKHCNKISKFYASLLGYYFLDLRRLGGREREGTFYAYYVATRGISLSLFLFVLLRFLI